MSVYYKGFFEAYNSVKEMNSEQLLEHIDSLYGRENLPEDFTHEDLLFEGLIQTKKDWIKPYAKERIDTWIKIFKAC